LFCLLAILIAIYILFSFPRPGVADQGDFDRVMNLSGLELRVEDKNNPDFVRFLDYPVTDYKITAIDKLSFADRLSATSLSYLINLISWLCLALGQDTFKTSYLAFAYIIIYILALSVTIKFLNIKNQPTLIFLLLLSLFVFLDGNYLVWFNSLYGEPMMITTLMLYIAAWVYYIYHRFELHATHKLKIHFLLIFIAAFFFLGSKMQVISALPIIMVMLIGLYWENKVLGPVYRGWLFGLLLAVIVIYPVGLNQINKEISLDTQYNSVFYGILKDSPHPVQDLLDMELSPDMAVEAGKHAYLTKEEYVRYVPHSDITQADFYSQISNLKLIKYYITHPARFINGMAYTARQSFVTATFLGKYPRSYSQTPIREFERFTYWSSLKEHLLPQSLRFLIIIYTLVLAASLILFAKSRADQVIKSRIKLFWAIMFIGWLQFPMPYVGNGEADTAKQLFLFNFIFDIVLVVSVTWCFSKLIDKVNQFEIVP
ncbi:MAG: hypothetical protein PHF24_03175, partial [Syntrophomonas sp.]|nr:hypothetical protein [Syntrophomonas sp.]